MLGTGVRDGGTSVQSGFGSAADQVKGVPLVGGSLADALQGAGRQSGGRVAALGRQGEEDVHRLALILGLVVFALPTILLLALLLPRRVRQIRQLTAAERVLTDPDDPQRRRVLAMRAAFGLPYGTLVAYTADPLGDIVQEPLRRTGTGGHGRRRHPSTPRWLTWGHRRQVRSRQCKFASAVGPLAVPRHGEHQR